MPISTPTPKRTDKEHFLGWLDLLRKAVENGEYNPEAAVLLITEQEGNIHRLTHLLCNVGPVEAIGLLHMAAGDIRDDPPPSSWNDDNEPCGLH